jgi:FkbM family methyltransferase
VTPIADDPRRLAGVRDTLGGFADRSLNRLVGDRVRGPSEEVRRRVRLLDHLGVTLVLDVGANTGGYSNELRRGGYEGRIVSFEPLAAAFGELQAASAGDPLRECRQGALGSEDGTAKINVAGNPGAASSSLLPMKDRHLASAPESRYVGTEAVTVSRLDSIWDELAGPRDIVFLKLDVQGFEMEVLRGAEEAISALAGIQAELNLAELYEGAPDYLELIEYFGSKGLRLAGLEAGHDDLRTGEMLQADGIFIRD